MHIIIFPNHDAARAPLRRVYNMSSKRFDGFLALRKLMKHHSNVLFAVLVDSLHLMSLRKYQAVVLQALWADCWNHALTGLCSSCGINLQWHKYIFHVSEEYSAS